MSKPLAMVALLSLGMVGCKSSETIAPPPVDDAGVAPSPGASSGSAASSAALPPNVLPPGITNSTEVPDVIGFDHYDNARFDFAVDYPTFVKLEAPSEQLDGQSFNYFNRVHAQVHGIEAAKDKSIDDLFRAATAVGDAGGARPIVAKTRTKDGYVVERADGERVVTDRLLTNGKTNVRLHLDYEASSRARFEKAAKHMVDSLHFGAKPRVAEGPIENAK